MRFRLVSIKPITLFSRYPQFYCAGKRPAGSFSLSTSVTPDMHTFTVHQKVRYCIFCQRKNFNRFHHAAPSTFPITRLSRKHMLDVSAIRHRHSSRNEICFAHLPEHTNMYDINPYKDCLTYKVETLIYRSMGI